MMQILLLQTFSTCFGRMNNTNKRQLVSVILTLHFTELPVPVAAVSVFYTPDDGRMTPETCRESLQ